MFHVNVFGKKKSCFTTLNRKYRLTWTLSSPYIYEPTILIVFNYCGRNFERESLVVAVNQEEGKATDVLFASTYCKDDDRLSKVSGSS